MAPYVTRETSTISGPRPMCGAEFPASLKLYNTHLLPSALGYHALGTLRGTNRAA